MKKKAPKRPLTVEELAEQYNAGRVCLDYALLYLLQHRRSEPFSVALVKALQKAIEYADLGQFDVHVPFNGGAKAVRQLVDEYGLNAFVRPRPHQEE